MQAPWTGIRSKVKGKWSSGIVRVLLCLSSLIRSPFLSLSRLILPKISHIYKKAGLFNCDCYSLIGRDYVITRYD